MFYGKCAYCESKITHIDYPHIEHYRPKKKYPHYTFEWQNLLSACGKCKGKEYKSDHFPLKDGDENKPVLLNPCQDDPVRHLKFEKARVVPLSERGHQTCDILGLNREELWEQRRERLSSIDSMRRLLEVYNRNDDETNIQYRQNKLNNVTSTEAEYTAMVRQFMANSLPERPPL